MRFLDVLAQDEKYEISEETEFKHLQECFPEIVM